MAGSNIFRLSEETASESSMSSEETPAPVVKKKVGRPRFEEGVVQTAKPDYWKNNYHEKRTALIPCPVCGQMVTKNNFSAHKKSMKCRLKGLEKEKAMKSQ